ncbi:MAG TPA: response regulator transcription factor [Terracidiphilus sp.]|jgi:FixJ family two-component response regulator
MSRKREDKLVAIVDDDDSVRGTLQELLRSAGFPSKGFESAEAFLGSGHQQETACLITDIRMPGMSGLELQARLNAEHCRVPIIFITAHGDEEMRYQALRAGAVEFLPKPFDDEVLVESVRAALDR